MKISLVTGSSSGIGQAIALRLAKEGFHVLAHYHRNSDGAGSTCARIREAGGSAEAIGFDVGDPRAGEGALEAYFKDHPEAELQVLVNNAGIHRDGLTGLMSDSMFDDVIRTNVHGAFYLMRWCVRRMIRQRAGVIVNVASLSGQLGNSGQINYAASKAALIAMTKSLSQEVGPRGIRVNAVAPGLIETAMLENVPHLESLKERIPLRRLGLPEEVAGVVAFLVSQDASYVTGHTLSVNGGLFPA